MRRTCHNAIPSSVHAEWHDGTTVEIRYFPSFLQAERYAQRIKSCYLKVEVVKGETHFP